MTEKKSNFLPLLLIGGGLAGAALLYGFGTKQSKEDYSLGGAVGVGGSGDFLGSSGISKGYDSTDLGIEDFAYNRAMPDAYSLPSDGAASPENVIDERGEWSFADGNASEWTFADTAALGITAAAVAPTVAKAAKSAGQAVKSAGSKVVSSAAGQAVKSAGSAVSGSTVRGAVGAVVKRAGVLGAIATGITALVGTAAAPSPVYDTTAIYTTSQSISTDLAAKVGIGNMVSDSQLKHATGLSAGKYPVTVASKEETALVNKAVGLSSGDVLKVSGSKFTSYVPEKGMQVTFSKGGTLAGTVNTILANKARKEA